MKVKFVFLFTLLILPLQLSWASFEFSPINMELTTSGASSVKLVKVKNKINKPVAVKIRVSQRIQNLDGTESRPETDEIKIFPFQVMLKPGESRIVKVSWVGEKDLLSEKSFRILAEQVPVEFAPEKAPVNNINILTNYSGTIYVFSKADLLPVVTALSLEKKSNQFLLHLKNSGTKRKLLRKVGLEITCKQEKDKKHILPKQSLGEIEGHNILSSSEIKYPIDIPLNLRACEVDKWNFTHD
jgi:fimbrial chaperone protein